MVGNCNRERMHKMCICIYVDQLNNTLSLSFGKAVVFTSEYALHL